MATKKTKKKTKPHAKKPTAKHLKKRAAHAGTKTKRKANTRGRPSAKRPAPKRPAATKLAPVSKAPPANGDESARPWQRIQYEDGGHGLFFSIDAFDELDVERLFEDAEAYPNGYGWQSVIEPAFEARFPDVIEGVSFDCEADTFVARADDAAALDALAQVIGEITASAEALAAALARRNPDLD